MTKNDITYIPNIPPSNQEKLSNDNLKQVFYINIFIKNVCVCFFKPKNIYPHLDDHTYLFDMNLYRLFSFD